jgi:UrcA family protein
MNTRRLVARRLACSLASLTALALAGSALAQERQDMSVKSMTVHFGDLNMSTTAGATALYQRIRGAARMVCGAEDAYERGLYARLYWHRCYESAVNDAVDKVHSPLLEAVHRQSTPETPNTAMLRR